MEKIDEGKFFRRLQELNEENERLKNDIQTIQKVIDGLLISITLEHGLELNGMWRLAFKKRDIPETLRSYNINVSIDEEKEEQVIKVVKRKEEE